MTRLAELIEEASGHCPISEEDLDALSPFAVEDRYPMLSAPEVGRAEAIALVGPAEIMVGRLEQEVGSGG